jgi:hypothetical protein
MPDRIQLLHHFKNVINPASIKKFGFKNRNNFCWIHAPLISILLIPQSFSLFPSNHKIHQAISLFSTLLQSFFTGNDLSALFISIANIFDLNLPHTLHPIDFFDFQVKNMFAFQLRSTRECSICTFKRVTVSSTTCHSFDFPYSFTSFHEYFHPREPVCCEMCGTFSFSTTKSCLSTPHFIYINPSRFPPASLFFNITLNNKNFSLHAIIAHANAHFVSFVYFHDDLFLYFDCLRQTRILTKHQLLQELSKWTICRLLFVGEDEHEEEEKKDNKDKEENEIHVADAFIGVLERTVVIDKLIVAAAAPHGELGEIQASCIDLQANNTLQDLQCCKKQAPSSYQPPSSNDAHDQPHQPNSLPLAAHTMLASSASSRTVVQASYVQQSNSTEQETRSMSPAMFSPPNSSDCEEDDYEIAEIQGKRLRGGIVEYLVSWKGYPLDQSTWEPLSHFKSFSPVMNYEERESECISTEESAIWNRQDEGYLFEEFEDDFSEGMSSNDDSVWNSWDEEFLGEDDDDDEDEDYEEDSDEGKDNGKDSNEKKKNKTSKKKKESTKIVIVAKPKATRERLAEILNIPYINEQQNPKKQKEENETKPKGKKRNGWTTRPQLRYKFLPLLTKLAWVEEARINGVRFTARKYNIKRSTLSDWMKKGLTENETRGGWNKAFTKKEELDLRDYVLDVYIDAGLPFDNECFQLVASQKWRMLHRPTRRKQFSCSAGWVAGWKKRNGISSRRPRYSRVATNIATAEDINAYLAECASWPPDALWNMDETYWRLVHNRIVTFGIIGSDSPKIFGENNEKEGFTATLCVSKAGQKLPLFVIKKGKTARSTNRYVVKETEATITFSPRGWCNSTTMIQFLEWFAAQTKQQKRKALILDQFSAHWEQEVKDKAKELNVTLIPVPAGRTSTLQPLDVGINGILKACGRRLWKYNSLDHRTKKQRFEDGLSSLLSAFNEVTEEHVKKAFDKALTQ